MSKLAKATIGLMIVTLLGKILGFARELVLASTYGATMYSDAYIIAMNIPVVILVSIGAALTTTFIPIYYDISSNIGEERALKFTNNIFNVLIIICILMSVIGLIYTEEIVKVFAIGFKDEVFTIAVKFTRILIVGILFTGLSYIITAYLQVKNNFIIPGLISIPYNIIIITSMIISINYGPYVMVWGTLLGMGSQFIFQIPFAIKHGYRYKLYVNIKDKYIKKTICLIGPVLISVGVNQVNTMIDRTLASTLVEGSISALNYANKLNSFVMAMFITSIVAVIFPTLSKLSSEDNKEKFVESIVKSINSVVLLVVPISIGAVVLSTPIVKILFQRGEFDARATSMTSIALAMYSIGMLAFGLRDILGKVFYSVQDTKTPMINGVIAMLLNIFLNIVLVKYLGHAGLALGTSLSAILCIILLFRSLSKKIGYYGQDKINIVMIKSIISAIFMGFASVVTYKGIIFIIGTSFISELISLILAIVVGALIYICMVIILKIDEVRYIIDILRNKVGKLK